MAPATSNSGNRQLLEDAPLGLYAIVPPPSHETNNGADMALYNELLEAAVGSIVRTFQKRVAVGLQSGRDFKIPDQDEQARDTTDFDLVTWLIIKTP